MAAQGISFSNHSMMDDLNMDPDSLFFCNIRCKPSSTPEFRCYLGHLYSVGLEELARENLNANPNPAAFLAEINRDGQYIPPLTLVSHTPSSVLDWTVKYFKRIGLSESGLRKIISEVFGPSRVNYYRV